jgi:hypothetical protein
MLEMNVTHIVYIVVISFVVLLASYLIGGTYSIVPVSNANAVGNYVMNRYTGTVWLCNVNTCKELTTQAPAPAPAN